jgi:hypothetical protein
MHLGVGHHCQRCIRCTSFGFESGTLIWVFSFAWCLARSQCFGSYYILVLQHLHFATYVFGLHCCISLQHGCSFVLATALAPSFGFFLSLYDLLCLGVVPISISLFCYFTSLHLVFLAYLNVYCCGIDVILLLLLHWHSFISCFFHFASSYNVYVLFSLLHLKLATLIAFCYYVNIPFVSLCLLHHCFCFVWLTLQLFPWLLLHHHYLYIISSHVS